MKDWGTDPTMKRESELVDRVHVTFLFGTLARAVGRKMICKLCWFILVFSMESFQESCVLQRQL